ncbi:MAG: NTP transferase domain-containing protein [Sulfurospirillum sp.]|nr:NTP transferase domain-containing protein [Sulfurospirillum sp.]MBL0703194.1 NTP transferase domain-containing protein [Sulfurospirillum sp.]
MIYLPCVIVAGGKSSRMGEDKSLLPFGGFATLTQFQLNLHKNNFISLHVSCKTKEKFSFEANFIEDVKEFKEFSSLVALYSVLQKFETDVCILSVDTPFVNIDIFEKLFTCKENYDAIIAKSPYGSHQLCAIYSPKILHVIKKQLKNGNHKIRDILNIAKTKHVYFSKDRPFLNINYEEDYKKAKKLHKMN